MKAVPDLLPPTELTLPESAERTLPNGLTVIAIRRASVPLVELRLRIPFGQADLPGSSVLVRTLLSGTEQMSNLEIAAEVQATGGTLTASVNPDRLLVSGNALASRLGRLLEILAGVMTGANYPDEQVGIERDRLADRIHVARKQPTHLVQVALLKRIYGDHPYGVQTPQAWQVREVSGKRLRQLHAERVHPRGATLVLVGDLDPEATLDLVADRLGGWDGGAEPVTLPATPPLEPGPLLLADRPESVQSSLRLALPAVDRHHPDHPALQLANLIFGGYFSSRWVENIREDKGYSYSPRSAVEHSAAGSVVVVAAEVATEVTAPALLETWYELGRLACLPPEAAEVEQARQYAIGTVQLNMSTQAGLAGLASVYAGFGLRLDYLLRYVQALTETTVDDVAAVAARYLSPTRAVPVVLGDATRTEAGLAQLGPVTREPS